MTALRVNPLAVGLCILYFIRRPALAIKGKLSELRLLIGPASCTGARRVNSGALGARDLRGERERERQAIIAKDWRK